MDSYFVGVDVGTGSVRAALVTRNGKVLQVSSKDTKTWSPRPGYFEQSSDDIWEAVCCVVKEVTKNVDDNAVKGIGFDATCSLVVVDAEGLPLSVSPTGKDEQNVILWLDHRAHAEAAFINSLQHAVLQYVGGKISLEMETPKLLWLKRNLRQQCWDRVGYFFDLPDFLTWRATGADSRSLCSLVCKWTYEAHPNGNKGWSEDYFQQIGLSDLMECNWKKIGSVAKAPGAPCGRGLTDRAARELGLPCGTSVGTSIIDAHAGGLGMIGCSADVVSEDFHTRLSLICGTSTCHMALSKQPLFVEGVWGPYYSAMVPGYWLNEGGQSATGKLVDHVIDTHPATAQVRIKIGKDVHIQQYLHNLLVDMAQKQGLESISELTSSIHVWPDFHGNRSPLADSSLLGMICGLTLSADEDNLALVYLATLQALAYGTRHIVDVLRAAGHSEVRSLLICGGLSRSPLFVQTQADVADLPVLCPCETESVLVGAAILGACAAGVFPDVCTAIRMMGGAADIVWPRQHEHRYHEKKYKVFLKMVEHQKEYRSIMSKN
ncbi:FGGY carbohydrate kinase domain-containing protein [Periplaneta americana]|uniref:FGGY carbohydrate kinase domain-containing protein n=1 Tax=Periplaneta americana TaxID=6978 RepID=UPI0037E751DC